MALFSLGCTTCGAKLKVHNASAIGEILACPKCHGMVLIEPPAGWQPEENASDSAIGSAALISGESSTSLADTKVDLPAEPAAVKKTEARQTPAPREKPPGWGDPKNPALCETADDLPLADSGDFETHGDQPSWAGEPPPASSASEYEETETAGPLLPSEAWTSPATQKMRKLMLMGASAVIGVLLALFLFGAIVARMNRAPVAVLPDPNPQTDSGETPAVPVDPKEEEKPPKNPQPPEKEPREPAEIRPPQEPVDEPREPENPPLKPGPEEPPADPEEPQPEPIDPAVLAATLDQFAPFIDSKPFEETLPVDPEAPTNEQPPEDETEPAKIRLPRPAPRQVDLSARLADPLLAIEMEKTPLVDVLQMFIELSTIPITLEPASLLEMKLAADAPVTVKLQNTTVGDVLKTLLAEKQLVMRPTPDSKQLLVIRAPGRRETEYEVADLASESSSPEQLAQWVKKLVQPSSWHGSGGEGTCTSRGTTLVVNQSHAVHFQVFLLLEKLRAARGKPAAGSYEKSLFQEGPRGAVAAELLDQTITLNYSQSTSFLEILKRLRKTTGASILVDWQALAQQEWTPDGETTLIVEAQSLAETLTALTEPMDLAWRVVDANTIQITTPAALAAEMEIAFYSLPQLAENQTKAQELMEKIKETMGPARFQSAGGAGAIEYDFASRSLFVSLSSSEQQTLALLLAAWSAETP